MIKELPRSFASGSLAAATITADKQAGFLTVYYKTKLKQVPYLK